MAENSDGLTPMFAQYRSIKEQFPDALLFFRMGDFYEMFFEDAQIASRELQITLTSRNKGANTVPMAGVPYHAAQSYLAQLIDRGYSVAICEQVENPKQAKGLVKRAVTSVITPGTILDEGSLGAKHHNYLGAIFCGLHDACAFAWADISTGQWTGTEFRRQSDMWQWVRKLGPAELILMDGQQIPSGFSQEGIRMVRQPAQIFEIKRATERLLNTQGVKELGALGLADKPALIRACGAILAYLDQTQMGKTSQLMPFAPLDTGKRLLLDEFTERNLEIFVRLNGKKGKGTLIHLLDETVTPMGGRLLEDMLHHPFRELKIIRQIQEAVGWLSSNEEVRTSLRGRLEKILDLERIIMRIAVGRCSPRDFASLRQSLSAIPDAIAPFSAIGLSNLPFALANAISSMADVSDLAAMLNTAIVDSPPASLAEGGVFKPEFNAELDRQLDFLEHGEQKLKELLEKEQEAAPKLKMGYNRVFGYYYELPAAAVRQGVPEHFIRRQTLANSERFTTEELKKLEQDILAASERRVELEQEMFQNLTDYVSSQKDRILQTADIIAHLDYWQSLAHVGAREMWCMPEINDKTEIHIKEGRHPVIESIIGRANFIPNDFHMDNERRMCLLTGPNMAGKSTILRQVALISLLAQIGSMVPATTAELGIVDRIFSRVGASDNLAQGQSTFMVEMMETARILRQSTRRSLIILDEIGRGTSTYDGMAIAWAVVEELASRCQRQLRTIFATHYHELTSLEGQIPGLFTMNIAVGNYDNKEILFLHRLLPGPADKSYGVEVARLAGIPYPVVQRARDILRELEQNRSQIHVNLELPGLKKRQSNIIKRIQGLKLEDISPEQALEILKKLQKETGRG